jgi:riboflavin kinase/FMN adenylyltransferase
MNYKTKQIKGKGRGKLLGFPTINLEIPSDFHEEEGIYAAMVVIDRNVYKGALHYGPVPTFNEKEKSLEVYLIDADEKGLINLKGKLIQVGFIKKIRDIKKFSNLQELSLQIAWDVEMINSIM